MMTELEYGAARDEREEEAYGELVRRCFNVPRDQVADWLQSMGRENQRLLRRGGRVVAGLGRVEMGQYFGGRRVPMTGIAAVGVPPEGRGQGFARELMACLIAELAAEGRPLSALYPATYTLYRGAGYEQAGGRYQLTVPAGSLASGARELHVREIEESDEAAVEACYDEHARGRPGYLARGDYCWNRTRKHRGEDTDGYLVERDGGVTGYTRFHREARPDGDYDLALTDLVAKDAQSARRLMTLLADHRSLAIDVRWTEGPESRFEFLLPERSAKVELVMPWMLRIVEPRAALEARGYAPELECDLHFELRDAGVTENSRRFVLQLHDGRGSVEAGGRGELALDERGLAALYSGYLGAEALRACGRLEAASDVLGRASAIFAGPAPGMADMF